MPFIEILREKQKMFLSGVFAGTQSLILSNSKKLFMKSLTRQSSSSSNLCSLREKHGSDLATWKYLEC